MVYGAFLFLHSAVRWLVLGAGLFVVVKALMAQAGGHSYDKQHRAAARLYVSGLHLNLLIGLVLYLAVSPTTTNAFGNMAAVMKNGALRFFVVEHPFGMLIAIVLATVGAARVKRAADDAQRLRRTLVFHGISLLIVLGSIPWPFYPAGRPLLSLPF
jgi:hypothetical protein